MKIIKSESPFPVDVDDTLILYEPIAGQEEDYILVKDPYEEDTNIRVWPHKAHIKLLKDKKSRRSKIIVWSQSGFEWAAAVVKALELEAYVDFVMTKPHAYMDDLPATEWMGARVYLPPDSNYKTNI